VAVRERQSRRASSVARMSFMCFVLLSAVTHNFVFVILANYTSIHMSQMSWVMIERFSWALMDGDEVWSEVEWQVSCI
jgi:hypothetical protein